MLTLQLWEWHWLMQQQTLLRSVQFFVGIYLYHLAHILLLFWQVWAEDADVLIMLVHHCSNTNHPLFLTTSKGSYDVRRICEALSERQRHYLFFCHAFTGCDTVSSISGHGKTTLFEKLCAGDIDEHMDIFLDMQATKNAVIEGSIAFFEYIYNALLLWEKFDTICSPARQQLGWSNQRLYLQLRGQLHNTLSVHISKPGTGCSCKTCLWTPVSMAGQ